MRVLGEDKITRQLGDCENCPLKDCVAVLSPLVRNARLVVIGEAPGPREAEQGDYFVGATGRFMRKNVERHGTSWEHVQKENAVRCYPEHNLSAKEWAQALRCCRPHIDKIPRKHPHAHTILALGKMAMKATTGKMALGQWFGAPMKGSGRFRKLRVVASFHPAFAMRKGKRALLVPIAIAIQRATLMSRRRLTPWKWPQMITTPGPEMLAALRSFRREKRRLAVDIENAGHTLTAIGIGHRDLVVSTPWDGYSAGKYGEQGELVLCKDGLAIAQEVRAVLEDPEIPKTLQNGIHDVVHLRRRGIFMQGYAFDTLLAHHVAAPQLPHKLGFIAGIETPAPAWKAQFRAKSSLKGEAAYMKQPPRRLRRYNGSDVGMTDVLTDCLDERIGQTYHGRELFDELMEVGRIAVEMNDLGVAVSLDRLKEHSIALGDRLRRASHDIQTLVQPLGFKDFNPDSHKQLVDLFIEKLHCRVIAYSEKTHSPSIDDETLTAYLTDDSAHARAIARAVRRYRQWGKLKTNYVDRLEIDHGAYPVVHPPWNVAGAITGRWSCWMNQIPKPIETRTKDGRKKILYPGLRNVYIPRPGMTLVKADYKALELRLVAMYANAKKMVAWFMAEMDVHTKHAVMLIGHGDESFEPSKNERTRIKNFVYNANYLGAAPTIHNLLVAEGIDVTLKEVIEMMAWYFRTHPEIPKWQEKQVAYAREHDYVEDSFSHRRRYFFGAVEPTEAVNFPVQSAGAYLMNRAIVRLRDSLTKDEHILIQNHDELVVEGKDPDRLKKKLKDAMEHTLEFNGVSMRYSVDTASGPSWGETKED